MAGSKFGRSNWSPFATERSRPSRSSRRQSAVPGSAPSVPTMARATGSEEMSSSCRSKMPASSASKPTMNPPNTSSPAAAILRTASPTSMRRFCFFPVSFSAAGFGVSIPTNTALNPASAMAARSAGSPARSRLASVMQSNGRPCSRCQRAISARIPAARRRFPMKLSSTRKSAPRAPSPCSASSSATTCAGDFTRGTRPNTSTMSQNSQLNGQPRETWIA